MQRLDRFLSEAGVAARRELGAMIRAGRVSVDGAVVTRPEQKVDEASARVCVDGVPVGPRQNRYLLLYKPEGYVCSTDDPRDPTVLELLGPEGTGLFPVGRLDKQTEGLLLLTDDGPLAHALTSPKRGVEKVYLADCDGTPGAEAAAAFAAGLTLRDGTVCRPARLEVLGPGRVRVTVHEGKYHQVRRMLAAVGTPVLRLLRERVGPLTLEGLTPGQWRNLTNRERSDLWELSAGCHF